ncbi:ATP-binding protein [Radiobacillus sp. PE A8.2]|uniref:ATP-binding protein n=1 Tax=Radiobacillus sp. PE A8.2 TaxID=3380349 RepID=UPI0038911481
MNIVLVIVWVSLVLRIFIGGIMFSREFVPRNHFFARFSLSLMGIAVSFYLFSTFLADADWNDYSIFGSMFFFLLSFLITVLFIFICYKESVWAIMLCGITGYTVHHLASEVFNVIRLMTNLDSYVLTPNFSDAVLLFLLEGVVLVVVYTIVYIVFARKANLLVSIESMGRNVLVLLFIMLFMMIIISNVRDYYFNGVHSVVLTIITCVFSILGCVLVLMVRAGILEKGKLEREVELIQQLRYQEHKQYEQRKEYIELINIKSHDLKRLIEKHESKGTILTKDELNEIKDAITMYDTSVKTGNETLDTIIAEKSLYCANHGIKFSCIADGEKLNFLSVSDIYSLFGNAMENALEAVSLLEKDENRIISFIVKESKGMISINIENTYAGRLVFNDGLPLTTKENTKYHGYGLKSIRHVVDKYGGTLTTKADEVFRLNILMPIP